MIAGPVRSCDAIRCRTSSLPPGPVTTPLFQILRWVREPLAFLDECAARFGDAFTIRLAEAPPLVVFTHPRDVRDIVTADADRLEAGAANAALTPVLGPRSLLLLDGPRHREMRRLLMPPFHGERLAGWATTMRDVAEAHVAAWPRRRTFSLHAAMQELALDVVLRTVFADDPPATRREIRRLVLALLALTAKPFVHVPWRPEPPRRTKRWREIADARARLDAALLAALGARRDSPAGRDVVALLLAARDDAGQPLADAELCDQLVTLLVAGHETTATALAWAFHHVLARPALAERLRAEADARHAPTIEATIDETLRLRPVFAVIGRRLVAPTMIAGWQLPAGAVAAPCIHLIHRRPDVWDDADRFDPDRFLRRTPTPYEFLPFGGGGRRCLGMAFALVEMRIVLGRVLAGARLRATGAATPSVRRGITFAPADGVPVVCDA